jgi:hypothetical protein
MIIQEILNEESPDSIYFSIPFFNIKKLRLPIAMELVKDLANPDLDERTKRVMFQILMKVELLDEEGNPLTPEHLNTRTLPK